MRAQNGLPSPVPAPVPVAAAVVAMLPSWPARALFYENEVDSGRTWIQFALRGAAPNTSAIGARVVVKAAGRQQVQTVMAGSGFAAQNSLVLHFGLGAATPEEVEIRWPSGRVQRLERPTSGRRHLVVEDA
jgi:hypothetical protein